MRRFVLFTSPMEGEKRTVKPIGEIKIAIFASGTWAFGRIFSSVVKHSRLNITLIPWESSYKQDFFNGFDLVYIPEFSIAEQFLTIYREFPRERVVGGPHCVAYIFYSSVTTLQNTMLTEEQIRSMDDPENMPLPKQLIEWLGRSNMPIGCVSRQLCRIFTRESVSRKTMLTRCGVEDDIVDSYKHKLFTEQREESSRPLTILIQTRIADSFGAHGYDMKRFRLIRELIQRFSDNPSVKFVYPDKLMSHQELDAWYDEMDADMCICTSHTEGNPMGLIEGIARGLIPLSTNCGVASELITPENGFIVEVDLAQDILLREKAIVEEMERIIIMLSKDRERVQKLKREAWKTADRDWRWSVVINTWDNYFKECHFLL